ncbi:hypothetical protein WMY93_022840 [Mugilogobius chulae]|uniref:Uncharacterized protein n=1 Tax=Mugilogobius chulae TaxID=88201 RepID=A0AAW0NB62_9GOBI
MAGAVRSWPVLWSTSPSLSTVTHLFLSVLWEEEEKNREKRREKRGGFFGCWTDGAVSLSADNDRCGCYSRRVTDRGALCEERGHLEVSVKAADKCELRPWHHGPRPDYMKEPGTTPLNPSQASANLRVSETSLERLRTKPRFLSSARAASVWNPPGPPPPPLLHSHPTSSSAFVSTAVARACKSAPPHHTTVIQRPGRSKRTHQR